MSWLMRPSKLPKAPSWAAVFLFGALYNTIAVQCWWAAAVCLGVLAILPLLSRLDRKLFS